MLSKEDLQKDLHTRVIGRRLFVFESIDSTNACARTLAEAGAEEGSVVIADFQTNGRGRQGRAWKADPNVNLLFSVLLRPELKRGSAGLLTFFAAVSVARAIEKTSGCSIECKWPNDLLLNGKKICGILLENSLEKEALAYSVVGIGLNVNQKNFRDDLRKASSLSRELGAPLSRDRLFQELVRQMDELYPPVRKSQFDSILIEWNARCRMFGKEVTVAQDKRHISGTAVALEPDGGLRINTPSGPETVYAGDVTVVSS
ncbi:MAG: biotin--[acetyl-CoA-carboxylase] ligase [Ignavibacteriales bacterium]|nr:biotin--[acetyl-CoA-carboxylase] ligase [Ignavibacteriales bacterium]